MANFSDLRNKEVINISDGKRLGYVCDIEVDIANGKITALVLPGSKGVLWLIGKNNDIVIPWTQIKKIGDDIILIEMRNKFEP